MQRVAETKVGSNSETVRRDNLKAILDHLHRLGPVSRSDLVARTGLNRSTVGVLVGELSQRGLVDEIPGDRGLRGRPSPLVRPIPESAVVLAVEIAVDSLAVALVGLGGSILHQVRLRLDQVTRQPQETVEEIAHMIEGLRAAHPFPDSRVVAVGVAVVGVVRNSDGLVHLAPNIGWSGVPLASLLADLLGISPVVVGNEADLACIAEHTRGTGSGIPDLFYLSGEVGIGGGAMVGGDLLFGAAGYGGEVGHMTVNLDGVGCRCGSSGCWETEIGEEALLRRLGRSDEPRTPELIDEVIGAAGEGDEQVVTAMASLGRWLGIGLATLINVFNPRMIVLGGFLARVYPFAAAEMYGEISRRALAVTRSGVVIEPSSLGDEAQLLGAAERGFERLLADPGSWTANGMEVGAATD